MCIPCGKIFVGTKHFYPWPWLLTYFGKYFNLGNNFWIERDRGFIWLMCIHCGKAFLSVPKLLMLWPWPRTLLLKKLNCTCIKLIMVWCVHTKLYKLISTLIKRNADLSDSSNTHLTKSIWYKYCQHVDINKIPEMKDEIKHDHSIVVHVVLDDIPLACQFDWLVVLRI